MAMHAPELILIYVASLLHGGVGGILSFNSSFGEMEEKVDFALEFCGESERMYK